MLIPPRELRKWFHVFPSGVLHVGAHNAEELGAYRQEGFGAVTWVEAQESLIAGLRKKIRGTADAVFQGIVWSENDINLSLNIASNGQSSSVYDLEEHSSHYPSIVYNGLQTGKSRRLDSLIPTSRSFDFVNLDIQGAELEALRGLGARLQQVRWVYSEVNRRPLYRDIPMIEELDEFLAHQGFARIAVVWTQANWGDALYVKSHSAPKIRLLRVVGTCYGLLHRFSAAARPLLGPLKKPLDSLYRILRKRLSSR